MVTIINSIIELLLYTKKAIFTHIKICFSATVRNNFHNFTSRLETLRCLKRKEGGCIYYRAGVRGQGSGRNVRVYSLKEKAHASPSLSSYGRTILVCVEPCSGGWERGLAGS